MGRTFLGICGLLVVIGLVCHPAQAGDRKSGRRIIQENAAADEFFIPQKERTMSIRSEMIDPAAARAAVSRKHRSNDDGEKEDRPAPARERKRLILFHINSKVGDIAVQPVFGPVNGAQFSIGF